MFVISWPSLEYSMTFSKLLFTKLKQKFITHVNTKNSWFVWLCEKEGGGGLLSFICKKKKKILYICIIFIYIIMLELNSLLFMQLSRNRSSSKMGKILKFPRRHNIITFYENPSPKFGLHLWTKLHCTWN